MKTFDEFLAEKAEAQGTISEGDNSEEEEEEEYGSDGEESESQQDSYERSEITS